MTDKPEEKIFEIPDHLAREFKAHGYTFNEELISSETRGEVVSLDRSVLHDAEQKRKAVLNIFKDEQAIGRVELDETRKEEPALTLSMYNGGNTHSHWVVSDPDVILEWTAIRYNAGAITPEEAGCFFVALAGYNLAKANANTDQHDSLERKHADIYIDAAKACLNQQRVPQNAEDALLMLSESETPTGFVDPSDDDTHHSRQGIEIEGCAR